MTFFVHTNHESQYAKLMDIVRLRSITYNHARGGGEYCKTELIGQLGDYNAIKEAIDNGSLRAELDINELQ